MSDLSRGWLLARAARARAGERENTGSRAAGAFLSSFSAGLIDRPLLPTHPLSPLGGDDKDTDSIRICPNNVFIHCILTCYSSLR